MFPKDNQNLIGGLCLIGPGISSSSGLGLYQTSSITEPKTKSIRISSMMYSKTFNSLAPPMLAT